MESTLLAGKGGLLEKAVVMAAQRGLLPPGRPDLQVSSNLYVNAFHWWGGVEVGCALIFLSFFNVK